MKNILVSLYTAYYRMKFKIISNNTSLGKGLRISGKLEIRGCGKIIIGKDCRFGTMPGSCKHVTLYTHNKDATIIIGNNVELFSAMMSSKYEIIIGDGVLIEEASISDTDFHAIGKDRHANIEESIQQNRVILEDNVTIGVRSVITKGVKIGKGAVVGPGSIVTRSVPANSYVIGNPARPMRTN